MYTSNNFPSVAYFNLTDGVNQYNTIQYNSDNLYYGIKQIGLLIIFYYLSF